MIIALLSLVACDEVEETTPTPDVEDTLPEDTLDTAEIEDEEEPEEEPEEEVPMSADDSFSQEACSLLESEPEELILAASESEAAQLTIVADGVPRRLVMPEKGDGWMVFEMPEWMAYLRIFTDEGVTYEIDLFEQMSESMTCGACPEAGIVDQSWAVHSWGSYPIQFHEGPEEIWFLVIEQ